MTVGNFILKTFDSIIFFAIFDTFAGIAILKMAVTNNIFYISLKTEITSKLLDLDKTFYKNFFTKN